jgi:hypothetical protein
MNAVRRVALILHALTAQDREWMLARLTPERRAALKPLLDELSELGIARDSRLVRELVADTTDADSGDSVSVIAQAPAAAAVEALAGEPAALIEWMLSLHAWPWRGDLLAALGRAKREQVEALAAARLIGGEPGGDALREASLHELAMRVRHHMAHAEPSQADRRLPKWMRFGRVA